MHNIERVQLLPKTSNTWDVEKVKWFATLVNVSVLYTVDIWWIITWNMTMNMMDICLQDFTNLYWTYLQTCVNEHICIHMSLTSANMYPIPFATMYPTHLPAFTIAPSQQQNIYMFLLMDAKILMISLIIMFAVHSICIQDSIFKMSSMSPLCRYRKYLPSCVQHICTYIPKTSANMRPIYVQPYSQYFCKYV